MSVDSPFNFPRPKPSRCLSLPAPPPLSQIKKALSAAAKYLRNILIPMLAALKKIVFKQTPNRALKQTQLFNYRLHFKQPIARGC